MLKLFYDLRSQREEDQMRRS